MNLQELIKASSSLADDVLPDDEIVDFVNDAIAAINIEANANFPSLHDMTDEPAFPEKWQRMLIIPFVKARIKEKDSSQFEWEVGYDQFYDNLNTFIAKYPIPEEYKDPESRGNHAGKSILDYRPYIYGGW